MICTIKKLCFRKYDYLWSWQLKSDQIPEAHREQNGDETPIGVVSAVNVVGSWITCLYPYRGVAFAQSLSQLDGISRVTLSHAFDKFDMSVTAALHWGTSAIREHLKEDIHLSVFVTSGVNSGRSTWLYFDRQVCAILSGCLFRTHRAGIF